MWLQIFVNSYPWLFSGGVGDIYNLERGEITIKEWGQHLLGYYDGQFLEDLLFGLFLYRKNLPNTLPHDLCIFMCRSHEMYYWFTAPTFSF